MGYGPMSDPLIYKSGQTPSQPLAPTITYDLTDAMISWQAQIGGGVYEILGYHVYFKLSDGEWTQELTHCDMRYSTDTECTIPLTVM